MKERQLQQQKLKSPDISQQNVTAEPDYLYDALKTPQDDTETPKDVTKKWPPNQGRKSFKEDRRNISRGFFSPKQVTNQSRYNDSTVELNSINELEEKPILAGLSSSGPEYKRDQKDLKQVNNFKIKFKEEKSQKRVDIFEQTSESNETQNQSANPIREIYMKNALARIKEKRKTKFAFMEENQGELKDSNPKRKDEDKDEENPHK